MPKKTVHWSVLKVKLDFRKLELFDKYKGVKIIYT